DQVDGHRRATEGFRRAGLAAVVLGEVVVEHDCRAVDLHGRVYELAVRARNTAQLNAVERLDVEVDGCGGVVDDQVRQDSGSDFDRHGDLLLIGIGVSVPTGRVGPIHRYEPTQSPGTDKSDGEQTPNRTFRGPVMRFRAC